MNDLVIIQNLDEVILLKKSTKRKFLANLDIKIYTYEFNSRDRKMIDGKEFLLNKLLKGEYKYHVFNTSINIEINGGSEKEPHIQKINCEEIFPDLDIDTYENITIDELKEAILELKNINKSLIRDVENLEDDIKDAKKDLEYANERNRWR